MSAKPTAGFWLQSKPIVPHPSVPLHAYSQRWADFVYRNRVTAGLTKRALAAKADCDPSYVTLFEANGYVPKRSLTEKIGRVFGREREALLATGRLPYTVEESVSPELLAWSSLHEALDPEVVQVCNWLAERTKTGQRHLVAQLAAYLRQEVAHG